MRAIEHVMYCVHTLLPSKVAHVLHEYIAHLKSCACMQLKRFMPNFSSDSTSTHVQLYIMFKLSCTVRTYG